MKNPFLPIVAVISTTYPATVVVEVITARPSGAITFPAFVGLFTAAWMLALAFGDYARKGPFPPAGPAPHRVPVEGARPARAPIPPGAAWAHHTASS